MFAHHGVYLLNLLIQSKVIPRPSFLLQKRFSSIAGTRDSSFSPSTERTFQLVVLSSLRQLESQAEIHLGKKCLVVEFFGFRLWQKCERLCGLRT